MRDRNLVELVGIRKAFGDNVVLDGVDLSVARGEVIVIAGPSGSGKSTMLRCVNGLETVDGGRGPVRRPAGHARAGACRGCGPRSGSSSSSSISFRT